MRRDRVRSRWRLQWAALLLVVVTACRSREPLVGPQGIQYVLLSIDGDTVPHLVSRSVDGSVITTVTDMLLTVFEDRTWQSSGHQTVTTNGVADAQVLRNAGTYAIGDRLTTFREKTGDIAWVGTIAETADTLTNAAGQVWVFER